MRKPATRGYRVRPRRVEELPEFDAAECLTSEAARLAYLSNALEGRDPAIMRAALADVERSRSTGHAKKTRHEPGRAYFGSSKSGSYSISVISSVRSYSRVCTPNRPVASSPNSHAAMSVNSGVAHAYSSAHIGSM